MSETCPMCGGELAPGKNPGTKTCPNGSTWAANGNVRFASHECAKIERVRLYAQIAALTQRAEQAEAKLRRYESAETADAKVMVAAFNKLTAAESELKRLREGIEAGREDAEDILNWVTVDDHVCSMGQLARDRLAFIAALLAQSSDGKEAGDEPGI